MTTTAEPTASASNAADRVRIVAARLRVTTDAKQGKETPQWVMELAGQSSDEGTVGARWTGGKSQSSRQV